VLTDILSTWKSTMTQTDFDSLIQDIKLAYESSDIKRYADERKLIWHWDVPTRIIPDSVLILGFNPGAAKGQKYDPPTKPYNEGFLEACNRQDAGSLSRLLSYLRKYSTVFPQSVIEQMGQANYCFFRSQHAWQISDADLRLCQRIFRPFLSIARPSKILCVSSRAKDFLVNSGMVSAESLFKNVTPFRFYRGNTTVECYSGRGYVLLHNKNVPIYFLPHPNYPIPSDVREGAWEFCFGTEY
jgi:hypothetical protein